MTDQPVKSTFKIALEAAEAMETENASLKDRLASAEADRDAAESEAAQATARAAEAEAKVQAVLNALGVGISATGKPHYSSSAADDEIVRAWPALDGEFLAREELEHRREIISALDTVAPKALAIEEIINEAWGWGRAMSVQRAQRILDRLTVMYPGVIEIAQAGDFRATVPIAPRGEDGMISENISVIETDWDAMLDDVFAKMQAGEIVAMPEPGTEQPAPRRRRKAASAPAPNPNAGVAAMMEAAERVMKAAAPAPAPAEPEPAPIDNDAAIIRALERAAKYAPGDFMKVVQLHSLAEAEGYTLTEGALRWRMTKGPNALATVRADVIETQASPLAWRLRDPKPDGGDKIDQPEAPVCNVADHVSGIIERAPGEGWTDLSEIISQVFKRDGWRPDAADVRAEIERLHAAGKIERADFAMGRRDAVKWKAPAEPAPDAAKPDAETISEDALKSLWGRAHHHLGWLYRVYGSEFVPMFRLADGSMMEIKQLPTREGKDHRQAIEIKRDGVWRLIIDRRGRTGTYVIEIEGFEIEGDAESLRTDIAAYLSHSLSFEAVHQGKKRKYGKILNMIGTDSATTVNQMLSQLAAENYHLDYEWFRRFVAGVVISPINDKIERNAHIATAWMWKGGKPS